MICCVYTASRQSETLLARGEGVVVINLDVVAHSASWSSATVSHAVRHFPTPLASYHREETKQRSITGPAEHPTCLSSQQQEEEAVRQVVAKTCITPTDTDHKLRVSIYFKSLKSANLIVQNTTIAPLGDSS